MLLSLFLAFAQIGLLSVGGGYAAIPLIQSEVVTAHGWLTLSEFTDLVTIAEMTPGPIAVNAASFVGVRLAGIPGALAATFGCIAPSLLLVSLLSWAYRRWGQLSALQTVMGCLRPAVVALIAAAGLSMVKLVAVDASGALDWPRLAMFAGALALLRVKRVSPVLVMLGCGALGIVLGLAMGVQP